MTYTKTFKRMPRTKWIRQIERLQDEIWEWKSHYQALGERFQYGWIYDRMSDRIVYLEQLWHELDQVGDTLANVPTVPRSSWGEHQEDLARYAGSESDLQA